MIHHHIQVDSQRLTPDLRAAAVSNHSLCCGKNLDKLSTKSQSYQQIATLSIYRILKKLPPIYGGWGFEVLEWLFEQMGILSTGRAVSPQFSASYPQVEENSANLA